MGFGSMGVQGAEAIHAQFNSLMMTDSCIHSVSSDDSIPWYGYVMAKSILPKKYPRMKFLR